MTTVNGVTNTDASLYAFGVGSLGQTRGTQGTNEVPPSGQALQSELDAMELPDLPPAMGGLSLDTLLSAIADEERRNGIQSAVDSLETHADAVDAENAKKLEEIKKQLDEMKNQSFWQKFCKVFQIIGMIVGAIASAATIVAGALTANPALIAAGVVGAVMTVDSIMSVASDGKVSIAAGFTALGKACGMSDETAKWFGFGMNMALVVAGIAVSFGAASGTSAASAGTKVIDAGAKAAKAVNLMNTVSTFSNYGSAATGIGQSIGNAALAVVNYNISKIEAKKVDIDAILENLRNNIKMNEDLIEEEMKAADALMTDVKEIVEDCNQTAAAILTVSPSAA